MKTTLSLIVGAVLGVLLSLLLLDRPLLHGGGDSAGGPCENGSSALYWVAPMDPNYRRDGPGQSPMGMDLVPFCETAGDSTADVSIAPNVEQQLGVRTVALKRDRLTQQIHAVGNIAWDETRIRRLHARADGWIEQLGVGSTGDRVVAGQMLYELFSPKLAVAESEYLAAGKNPYLRQTAEQRLRALGYEQAQIKRLQQSGQASDSMQHVAIEDGRVHHLGVRAGQYVTPGSLLMSLADPKKLWLIAELPEREAGLVKLGQQAQVSVAALPGRHWTAVISHIHPVLEQRTRTQRVRLELDNHDEALRAGMYAEARIEVVSDQPALLVPTQALIRRGQDVRVIRRNAAGQFDVVAVKLGMSSQQWAAVDGALEEGDEIVVSGQFLLDSEANVDAETLRLRSQPAPSHSMTMGIVRGVDPQRRFITLEHEYIHAIEMPAMTMSFDVADGVDLEVIEPGQSVHFMADKPDGADYRVISLEVMP